MAVHVPQYRLEACKTCVPCGKSGNHAALKNWHDVEKVTFFFCFIQERGIFCGIFKVEFRQNKACDDRADGSETVEECAQVLWRADAHEDMRQGGATGRCSLQVVKNAPQSLFCLIERCIQNCILQAEGNGGQAWNFVLRQFRDDVFLYGGHVKKPADFVREPFALYLSFLFLRFFQIYFFDFNQPPRRSGGIASGARLPSLRR